jgi:hypothetical protein
MRQVYFDPFGKYTEGYDAGASRQLQTEKDVRDARQQDYTYNVTNPLNTQVLKNEADLSTYALPLRERNAGYLVDQEQAKANEAQQGVANEYGNLTNSMYFPLHQFAANTGMRISTNGDGTWAIHDRNNNIIAPNVSEQNIHDYLNRDYNLKAGSTQAANARDYGQADYFSGRNATQQGVANTRADASMYGADTRAAARAGGYSPFDPFGIGRIQGTNGQPDYTNPGSILPAPPARQPQPQTQPQAQPQTDQYGIPPMSSVTGYGVDGDIAARRTKLPAGNI